MEGVTLILLLKIGLAGSTMAVYLRAIVWEKDKRSADISLVGFATLYALCSYVMAYYWCIMWMDAVALLPLCILGLHKILDGRSGVFYTVCLALVVFINYYMAIMVCIFILFYYPVLYFIKVQGESAGHFFKTTGRVFPAGSAYVCCHAASDLDEYAVHILYFSRYAGKNGTV